MTTSCADSQYLPEIRANRRFKWELLPTCPLRHDRAVTRVFFRANGDVQGQAGVAVAGAGLGVAAVGETGGGGAASRAALLQASPFGSPDPPRRQRSGQPSSHHARGRTDSEMCDRVPEFLKRLTFPRTVRR